MYVSLLKQCYEVKQVNSNGTTSWTNICFRQSEIFKAQSMTLQFFRQEQAEAFLVKYSLFMQALCVREHEHAKRPLA